MPKYPGSPQITSSSFGINSDATVTSWIFAEVVTIVWTSPLPAPTPMWHFTPNRHWVPFFVECISGSHFLSLFLVNLGASMMVAFTIVPPFTICPLATITPFNCFRNSLFSPCSSSKCRNLHSVVSSGTLLRIKSIPVNFRIA